MQWKIPVCVIVYLYNYYISAKKKPKWLKNSKCFEQYFNYSIFSCLFSYSFVSSRCAEEIVINWITKWTTEARDRHGVTRSTEGEKRKATNNKYIKQIFAKLKKIKPISHRIKWVRPYLEIKWRKHCFLDGKSHSHFIVFTQTNRTVSVADDCNACHLMKRTSVHNSENSNTRTYTER